jgi:hypothetical protein
MTVTGNVAMFGGTVRRTHDSNLVSMNPDNATYTPLEALESGDIQVRPVG